MKNKNSIIRQLYQALLRSSGQLDTRIFDIINYKDVRPIVETNPCKEISLTPGYYNAHYSILKMRGPPTQFPLYDPLDMERIRMFMFRYYKGRVYWDKLFFGNEKRDPIKDRG